MSPSSVEEDNSIVCKLGQVQICEDNFGVASLLCLKAEGEAGTL